MNDDIEERDIDMIDEDDLAISKQTNSNSSAVKKKFNKIKKSREEEDR